MTFINKKGFSLIEVLIAVLVLGVSTSALIGYQIKQSTTLEFSNMTLIATEAANNVLDEVQSKSKEIRKKDAKCAPSNQCISGSSLPTLFSVNGYSFSQHCSLSCPNTALDVFKYTVNINFAYKDEAGKVSLSRSLATGQHYVP
ncbi:MULTISPECIES: prepilin-type N-terminal cleavage/methylation domain-containing protein [Plesiomonas]|uniref:type IV pilus modification PilV family protein n=1 Tax=Plesiomonas TaxID=702 RepID=UPI0007EDAC12|nr:MULTISPECIES: prepilin-type N-terminal cleavage/methylation domain-containing protein [Plesiomonas]KAB7673497.1 prepilin-type N-terminal cleavage/methylation domain-containing protein [Plesiomonas shigelloides]KAB7688939.1 prepilin-type N-terminal cleavage/methylation domain-containing protein [Plesiomonas shigelloides]MCE5162828.1 prepilin-type N-terminal cleavage/methylation domain-containing protein [Plesiomonas sp. PI-19]MCQ8859811.1 prepilin-type N-terminal cleavage/methylation domain-c